MAKGGFVMIAIDTNLLVRLITNDVPPQAQLVLQLIKSWQPLWIPKTVLLELEWVLRAVYKIEREKIHQAFMDLLGLPNAVIEQLDEVRLALTYYQQGMDFADALHLATSQQAFELYTFDKAFIKIANQLNTEPVVTKPRGA
jgi:predicted nucleic-acid-binding protein